MHIVTALVPLRLASNQHQIIDPTDSTPGKVSTRCCWSWTQPVSSAFAARASVFGKLILGNPNLANVYPTFEPFNLPIAGCKRQ